MKQFIGSWQLWALLSATFAALTAIFAKIGIENVSSDFATFIRTVVVIICALAAFLAATDQWQPLGSVSGRSYLFLILSGLATGGSWVCYFRALKIGKAAQVAPIDKLSVAGGRVRRVRSGRAAHAPQLARRRLIALGAILVAYKP
jgi:transporter family protein